MHLAGVTLSLSDRVRIGATSPDTWSNFPCTITTLSFLITILRHYCWEGYSFIGFSRDSSLLISREGLSLNSHSLFLEGGNSNIHASLASTWRGYTIIVNKHHCHPWFTLHMQSLSKSLGSLWSISWIQSLLTTSATTTCLVWALAVVSWPSPSFLSDWAHLWSLIPPYQTNHPLPSSEPSKAPDQPQNKIFHSVLQDMPLGTFFHYISHHSSLNL